MGRLIMLDIKQIIQDSAHVKTAMLDACASDIQKGAQVMIDAIKASTAYGRRTYGWVSQP